MPVRRPADTSNVTSFSDDLGSPIRSGDQPPTLPHVVFQLHGVLSNEMAGQARVAK